MTLMERNRTDSGKGMFGSYLLDCSPLKISVSVFGLFEGERRLVDIQKWGHLILRTGTGNFYVRKAAWEKK